MSLGNRVYYNFLHVLLCKIQLPYHWCQREVFKKEHKSAILEVERLEKNITKIIASDLGNKQ